MVLEELMGRTSFIPVLLTLYLFSTVPGWTTFWEVWNTIMTLMIITGLFIIAKVKMHQTGLNRSLLTQTNFLSNVKGLVMKVLPISYWYVF